MAEKEATLIVKLKDEATNALRGLQSAVAGLGTRFLSVAGAVTALVAALISSAKAYMENEKAVNRLNGSLQSQGVYTEAVSKDLQTYAASLAKTSTFTDEALMATEAFFVTLGFGSDKVKKATQMAADLAARMGWDLPQATMVLGKALSGNEAILKRYGLTMEAVERMHGAAASQLNTLSGRAQNLYNRIDELKEQIGRGLLPTLEAWARWAEKIVSLMERMTGAQDAGLRGRQLTIAALQKESDQLATVLGMYDRYGKANTEAAKAAQDRFNKVQAALKREKELMAVESGPSVGGTSFGGKPSAGETDAGAKLDTETAAMLQKMTTRQQAIQQLKQQYGMTDAQMLVQNLGTTEALEAESLARRLEAAGKFNEAKKVREAAIQKAQVKNETDLAAWRKKQEEERMKNFSSTLQFISTLSTSKNKELAAIGKAASIANATISTYEAANKALASAPPPWNFALAALVVAAGMANVANIAGVALAQGGIVPARPGGTLATIGEGGRSEAVIPLGDKRAREALGGLGGVTFGNVYVTVSGTNDPRAIAERVGNEIIKAIRGQGQIDFTR